MINRIRRCSSRKEYEQLIDDYITMGYTVKARGEDNARLIKKGCHTKHGLVFLLTFWWTLGIGNLIYALIPVRDEDDILLKLESEHVAS